VLDDFEVLIADHGAHVIVEELPVVEVSAGAVRQVMQNLISNALKFCRPGVRCVMRIGPLALDSGVEIEEAFRDPTRYALVSVTDNGIGFDDKFRDRIFDLFQRLNTKDRYEGSGIGLAVAKRLMERAGGAIRVRSREGEGSEFVLVLPLSHDNANTD
jgi:two-component system CheB/CheR fusion protein